MKIFTIAIVCIAAGFGLAYLIISPSSQGVSSESGMAEAGGKQLYTCGMHPEIISDEPGYCPLCGMKLTPKKDGGTSSGAIAIDPTTTQNMGLVTFSVKAQPLIKSVTAFGTVEYDESRIHSINLKIEGWAEKIHVISEGVKVTRGQPLMEVYSPALSEAQQEYLIVNKSAAEASLDTGLARLRESARKRLQNWDLTDDQINRLAAAGEVTRNVEIVSPADGFVIAKKVDAGDHLRPGAELYRIADLSKVWITANVYEQDVPFVAVGRPARIIFPSLPGEVFDGTISYVSPYLDAKRQVEIRVELKNDDGLLRPDMYAEVNIESSLTGERLVVPRSAVINSGKKQIVYLAMGDGSFSSREITAGVVGDDDMIEIVSGLNAGDQVVVSGQFLLDSESRLNEALGGDHMHHHDMGGMDGESGVTEGVADDGVYTCPMPSHFHVLQYGPGKCPECNMNLVPVEQTQNSEVYVCPMTQCGVVQQEPGRCSVCGMNLVKYRSEDDHDK